MVLVTPHISESHFWLPEARRQLGTEAGPQVQTVALCIRGQGSGVRGQRELYGKQGEPALLPSLEG